MTNDAPLPGEILPVCGSIRRGGAGYCPSAGVSVSGVPGEPGGPLAPPAGPLAPPGEPLATYRRRAKYFL